MILNTSGFCVVALCKDGLKYPLLKFQNGLISQDNSALRDFSAKCIREFLEWSIKQTKIKVSPAISDGDF